MKSLVQRYWNTVPCGAQDIHELREGSREYFENIENLRYSGDDFMRKVVPFDQYRDRNVLEVGCGLGTDLLQFARGGAKVHAIDLTPKGASMTKRRLQMYGYDGQISVGDAENLPFPDDHFDLVYSWGVIHHTPDTAAAAREIVRVCKPGGNIVVMLYNRTSLVVLQAWMYYALFRGRPQTPAEDVIAKHMESPGTKTFRAEETPKLFPGIEDLSCTPLVTRFDLRLGRRIFLPRFMRSLVPSKFGWFLVIKGKKELSA